MTGPRTSVVDDYTGHVEPGSAARRTLPGATIVKASVGPMDNNAYLITCSQSGETLLVDAANDAPVLLELIERYAPKLALVLTTHQHGDHWQALAEVIGATGAPTAAHRLDAGPLPVAPDRILSDGDTVEIGELSFDVIHLQGHTEGSVALALSGPAAGDAVQLFTGDCLFPGGPGRTTNPHEFESLLGGLESKVFDRYGDDTVVYPGHGDDTTLGAERPHLGEWKERGW
ncbi:MBL fold metallo-hydrolase [Mycobacterium hodleri]|uniref:MBL fold metallo-hydrolase n=1 Tax=Mycolicibacterium hodleri TaxID=49897 RepID=UPI0021F2FCCE|nr:MBL fold metallo-hydrolase [Mycolicibacterium hodleri]MCV7135265.1 MBL fold metallo-hydrolase [Mycolicibacterium hodleri]